MAGIILRNLTKSYGKGEPVLEGINLEVHDQEFMVLVGPSGCGKSTILRVVSGLEDIDDGEILIDDRVVNDVPPRDRDIAMVFQSYALYPHMTVYENIAFGLRVRKHPKEKIDGLVREAADTLSLSSMLEKRPGQLSGGERQRVALGRAIVRKPKVFLFDEPLSNLDAKLRVQMRAEISALHERLRITTLYVTHDQVEAMTMGERITVLRDGLVQQVDKPMGLYSNPANRFVGEFIGSPPMNVLPARWTGTELQVGESRIPSTPETITLLANHVGREVFVGVRPELVEIQSEGEGLPARVELVEPMGGESNIYLTMGGRRLIARVDGLPSLRMGDDVRIRMPAGQAHFFDHETERRII